jgi:hypothetical protein
LFHEESTAYRRKRFAKSLILRAAKSFSHRPLGRTCGQSVISVATVSPGALLKNTAGKTQAGAKVSLLQAALRSMDGSIGWLGAAHSRN